MIYLISLNKISVVRLAAGRTCVAQLPHSSALLIQACISNYAVQMLRMVYCSHRRKDFLYPVQVEGKEGRRLQPAILRTCSVQLNQRGNVRLYKTFRYPEAICRYEKSLDIKRKVRVAFQCNTAIPRVNSFPVLSF